MALSDITRLAIIASQVPLIAEAAHESGWVGVLGDVNAAALFALMFSIVYFRFRDRGKARSVKRS